MRMLNKCLFVVGTCVAAVAVHGAEWLGTGGDTLWGNADNWQSSTGVPTGNIAISATAGDNLTLTLDGDHEFSGTFHVTTGTQEAPVVFNATAEAVGATNHVKQTSWDGFDVKSGGVLKIESGVYDWANDYRVADNSILWMTGGRMTTQYWGVISGTAQIIMDGGELVSGWRDGAEQDNGRLNLNGGTSIVQTGGRIRCANNTNKGNDAEALTIGDTAGTTSVSVSGGEISASGKIHLGKASGSVSTLSVSGTGVVSCSNDMRLGYGGANSTLTIADDGQVNVGTTSTVRYLYFDTGKGTINLNGGTLQVARITVSSTTTGTINFNGGVLKAERSDGSFLAASDYVTANVLAGGAVIDTDYGVAISAPLLSGVEQGETDGGLVKKGRGQLTLTGTNTYNGVTYVQQGLLSVTNGYDFAGGLRIGSNGAVSVDMTAAVDVENIAVDETLVVFKVPAAPTFEYAQDTLADSVFLTGPVFSYTLAYDAEQGAVVATVTDVSRIASTRKATAFIADNDYIDQDRAWSNSQPTDKSYDIVVFCADATMHVWSGGWGVGNNKACEVMAIRGATVLAEHTEKNWNPCLDKNKVVGHGTLQLSRLGLEVRNAPGSGLSFGENVKVEVVKTAYQDHDTWMTNPAIYGDFKVTTGYTILNNDAAFYGSATFANPTKNSYVSDSTKTGNAIYGDWIIEDGCHFDFNSAVMTIGDDARLILKGTGYVEDYANALFPTVVLGEGASMFYSSAKEMAKADGVICVADSATLKMSPVDVSGSASVVVLSNATVIVDASSSDAEVGDSLTLAGVTLADGVAVEDVTLQVGGLPYTWSTAVVDGSIVITATGTADGASRWVGGASGNWSDAINWSKGVPSDSLAALIDTDATIYIDANKTVSSITINANVLFRKSAGDPIIYIHDVDGTGKLGLYHVGFQGNGGDKRIGSATGNELTLEFVSTTSDGSDSWLTDVSVFAPMTGAGYARLYGGTRLYGDNSGFTGVVRKDDADCRFMTPESGFPNANKIEIYGTLWLWFEEGTIYLGGNVSMRSSGNRGINMPVGAATSENGVTLVLGGGDGTVTLHEESGKNPYQFYTNESSWTPGCLNATVRKIGTGTMTCRITGAYNFSAEGGTTVFTLDNADANVSVAAGAVISGNVTLGTVAFAPEAILAPTVTYTAAVPAVEDDPATEADESVAEVPASWTVSTLTATEASVQDLIVRLDDDSIAALANIPGERPLVLSASTLNGKPNRVAQDTKGDSIAADGSNIWLVRMGASGVTLTAGRQNPGFMIIVQ